MKLSILIPTTPDRVDLNERWYKFLTMILRPNTGFMSESTDPQYYGFKNNEVEVVFSLDDKKLTIGEKRERLYQKAQGAYSWQIDSDDAIAPNTIELILKAIAEAPDCITFQEECIINGRFFSSNHSLGYEDWGEKQDGFDYVRTPFMKSVIKTEIARSVPIPHIRYGEDHEWARALKPHLKTEVHIPEYLYFYQHNSKPEDHAERYGIK